MLKSCPACARNLDDHLYASFAITVASPDNKERLGEFCRLLKSHDWSRLRQFDDFDPLQNAIEAFAVKCVSSAIVLLAVRNPFELFDSNEVLDCEVLDSTAGKELDSLIEADKWRRLSIAESAA
ncbi:MAG: hypothetical protein ND895_03375 [Pyrinomonadaceae bacterium]|nr:hypothetical protein [Pyrinomonadaceae bacterium]